MRAIGSEILQVINRFLGEVRGGSDGCCGFRLRGKGKPLY